MSKPHRQKPDFQGLLGGLIATLLIALLIFRLAARQATLPEDFVSRALRLVPARSQAALVLNFSSRPPGPESVVALAQLLGAPPPPASAHRFILPGLVYFRDQQGPRFLIPVARGASPEGDWTLRDGFLSLGPPPDEFRPLELPAGKGGAFHLSTDLGRLWGTLEADLSGRFRFQLASPPDWLQAIELEHPSLDLSTLTAVPPDQPWVASLDVHLLQQVLGRFLDGQDLSRWGISLEEDLFPLLSGELTMALPHPPPEGPEQAREMPALLVLGLADPGAAERLHNRLLPGPMRTSLPYTIHKGVTLRSGLDQTFGYAFVADYLLVALNRGREALREAVDARLSGRSLAERQDVALLRDELDEHPAHLALAQAFLLGPERLTLAAVANLDSQGASGRLVVRWNRNNQRR